MNFLLWLFLVSSVHSSPTENFRRTLLSSNKKGLSNEDILEALSILISETEQGRMESKELRRGRHEFDDEFSEEEEFDDGFSEEDEFDDEFSEKDVYDDEFSEEEELDRQTIRGFSRSTPSFSGLEKCETTGFETRTREECEEVIEVECRPIMVKKIRTEIVEKCETLLDRKTCNVTYIGVPKQQCSPRTSKR